MAVLAFCSMRFACTWLLMLGCAHGALLRTAPGAHRLAATEAATSITSNKVAQLLNARSLTGSVAQVRRMSVEMMAGRAVPEWARPMPKCVKAVNASLAKLSAAYLYAHVPTVLDQSCESFEVSSEIGGSEFACKRLMKDLSRMFKGDRNYYPWCRSLTLASFDAMREGQDMFDANKTLTAWRDECSQHCPYISRMIEAGMKFDLFVKKFWMGEGPGSEEESEAFMMDLLEISLRQMNQVCDWQLEAKCNVHNVHSSCEKLLEAMIPPGTMEEGPKHFLVVVEEECAGRETCRNACHGVDSFLSDFTLQQFKLSKAIPLPNVSLGMQHCKEVDQLLTCTKHPECEKYISSKLFRNASEYLHTWEPTCKWFRSACTTKRENLCPSQLHDFRETWNGNWECLFGDVTEDCCKVLDGLAQCDAKQGCAGHLKEGVPLLEFNLEESIPAQCPSLKKTFA